MANNANETEGKMWHIMKIGEMWKQIKQAHPRWRRGESLSLVHPCLFVSQSVSQLVSSNVETKMLMTG